MNSDYFINAERDHRRDQVTRGFAAARHGRSRAAWLRRLLASDPALERRVR